MRKYNFYDTTKDFFFFYEWKVLFSFFLKNIKNEWMKNNPRKQVKKKNEKLTTELYIPVAPFDTYEHVIEEQVWKLENNISIQKYQKEKEK